MRKNRFFALACAALCALLLTVPAFAAVTRASDQIDRYTITATAKTGKIEIVFSVTGSKTMDKLGCESIYIYKAVGSGWSCTDSFSEDDTGMSKSNTRTYKNTITWDSEAGTEYRVVVTVFAEDSAGRDTRTQTFTVTGK